MACLAAGEDQLCGRDVQSEPEQCCYEEQRRKHAELERLGGVEGYHHDRDGCREVDHDTKVEHPVGHRHDEHADDREDGNGHQNVAITREPAGWGGWCNDSHFWRSPEVIRTC